MTMYRVEQLSKDLNLSDQLIAAERIAEAIETLAAAIHDVSHTLATQEVGRALKGLEDLPGAVMAVAEIANAITE